jgi:ParB family chromosome partitioning protein
MYPWYTEKTLMCALERGLGKGLDRLFRDAGEAAANREISSLPLSALRANPNQPRRCFPETALHELAQSIKTQGVIQPVLVRPLAGAAPLHYEIVAGERRWRAAALAGLTEVPVVIRTLSDDEALLAALIENLQREDLNAVEEAQAIDQLRRSLNLTQDELAEKLGKSRPAIANALRLLNLPSEILASLAENVISSGHARALLAVTDASVQATLHDAIVRNDLSVRDTEDAVSCWKRTKTLPESLARPESPAPAAARVKTPFIQSVQKHLRDQIHPKANLNGTATIGRLTLPYESTRQLADLLSQLGVNLEGIANDINAILNETDQEQP